MKKILVALCFVAASLASVANPMKSDTTQRFVADKVVAVVGNNIILFSDVEKIAQRVLEVRREQGSLSQRTAHEEALEMLLTNKLLATCAVMDSLDQNLMPIDEMVDDAMEMMVEQAGGVKALEGVMGKPIYQIRSDITLEKRQQQLAQTMEQHIKQDVSVDFMDVKEFYDTVKTETQLTVPEQYSYSQIVKIPPQTDERKYAIREQLLGYRQRILAGEVSLGVLAQLYSADRQSAIMKGEMGPTPTAYLNGDFVRAMEGLKPGEVSQIVETEYGFHIIELISLKEEQGMEMAHFRHILLKPEFTVEETKIASAQLDSLRNVITQGKLNFAEAALKYSDDVESKQNGGKVFNTYAYTHITGDIRSTSSRFRAEEMQDKPEDFRRLSTLKEGEVSAPFQTIDAKGNVVYKIIRLDQIIPAHTANVNDDFELMVADAEEVKKFARVDEWLMDNINRVYIEIDPAFWDYNFELKGWIDAAKRTSTRGNLNIEFPTREDIREAIDAKNKRDELRRLAEEAAAAQKAAQNTTK